MTTTPLRHAALVAALALGAAACGSDEEASGTTASTIAPAGAAETAAATTAAPATDAPATTAPEAPQSASPLVDALVNELLGEAETNASPIASRDDAECWATGIVDGIGEDRLAEVGVTPQSVGQITELPLTDAEVSIIVDSLFGCVDVQAAFADQFATQFGEEAAQCFAEQLDPELVKEMLGAQYAGGQPTQEAFAKFEEIASGCGVGG